MKCSWFFFAFLGLDPLADRRARTQRRSPSGSAPRQCFWVGALALVLLFANNARGDLNYPTYWSLSGRQTHSSLADINMNAGANGFTVTEGSAYLYNDDVGGIPMAYHFRTSFDDCFRSGRTIRDVFINGGCGGTFLGAPDPVPAGHYTVVSVPGFRNAGAGDCNDLTLSECRAAISQAGSYEEGDFTAGDRSTFLSFPLLNKTPFTAAINTVFDHSMSVPYCADTHTPILVTAYTGEQGSSLFLPDLATKQPCKGQRNDLFGYQQDNDGTKFIVNGNYAGAGKRQFLYYDSHPGFDYRTTDQKPDGTLCSNGGQCNRSGQTKVLAAAAGTVVCVNISTIIVPPCTEGPGEIKIDHANGYFTIYLHLFSNCVNPSDPSTCVNPGDSVGSQQQIGISGDTGAKLKPHLHFEVREGVTGSTCGSKCFPVDPYGWKGLGSDPYTRAVNINLWK